MAISLEEIPKNLMRPTVAFEIRGETVVGVSAEDYRPLAIVEKIAAGDDAGAGVEKKIYNVTSEDQAKKLFGKNSAGHLFYNSYAKNHQSILHMMPIVDSNNVKHSSIIDVKTAPTKDGRIELTVYGRTVHVDVTTKELNDTDQEVPVTKERVAQKIVEAIKKLEDIPVTVSATDGHVTVTSNIYLSKSPNGIPVEVVYNDTKVEINPNMPNSAPVVKYDITDALNAIGEEIYDFVCLPYSDVDTLKRARDWAENRRLALNALDGQCLALANIDINSDPNTNKADYEKFQDQVTSETVTVFANQAQETEPEILGAIVAQIAKAALNSPARPFQRKELIGVTPISSMFNKDQRNKLLQYGVSTFLKSGSRLAFERVMTLAEETSRFRDLNDALTIVMIRRDLVRFFEAKYPNHNITEVESGLPNTLSLNTFKVEYRGRYEHLVRQGMVDVQDSSVFQDIKIEKISDGIKVELPVKLLDQLRLIIGRVYAK